MKAFLWVGIVAQPNFFVRYLAGGELRDSDPRVSLCLRRKIGCWFVQPLFPKQIVKLPVTQVVCAVEVKAAGGGGIEQLPQPPGHLLVLQLGGRKRCVAERGKDFPRGTPGEILDGIDKFQVIGSHTVLLQNLVKISHSNFSSTGSVL